MIGMSFADAEQIEGVSSALDFVREQGNALGKWFFMYLVGASLSALGFSFSWIAPWSMAICILGAIYCACAYFAIRHVFGRIARLRDDLIRRAAPETRNPATTWATYRVSWR